ncbi:MAG: hypothetical protein OEQ13_03260 [Acidobacteriota bacterium]|nr:hypothetical protein [Acidobacteriota bacterium]
MTKRTIVFAAALAAFGCQQSGVDAPPPVPATPAAVQPAPLPPPPAPPSELHGIAPDAILSVTFKEINDKGYPMVVLKNLTGRDIEEIRGGFRLKDAEGNILHAAGLTIAVPGQLFLAADAEAENSPFGLNKKEELMQRLKSAPDELSFSFEAEHVTFMDGAVQD